VTGVSVYETEEEQVEAIKQWWKENGYSIIGGIVIGLSMVFGWQAWNQQQERTAADASLRYEKMAVAIQQGNSESALKQGEKIIAEWPDSNYAIFAALDLARLKLEQGDADAAKTKYQWVLANSDEASLKQLARLRLARILVTKGDLDGADAIIAQADKDNFAGEFAVVRGDIAKTRQDFSAARAAYAEALSGEVGNRQLVQMKLDDLAVAGTNP
jgi:predicted negative regulator of RcsB-dependent stress response